MAILKGEDLVKYITQEIVNYMETPREARKRLKASKKEAWQVRWFGMIPISMRMWSNKWRR